MLKKALIIFAILFILTLAVPVFAAFIEPSKGGAEELATIFSGVVSPFLSFRLFC